MLFTFNRTSIFSWVCNSKMLFDRARIISNLNSIIGRTMSKNSLIFVPWIWGKIYKRDKEFYHYQSGTYSNYTRQWSSKYFMLKLTWVNDFPVVWMTISGPNDMIKGKRENKYEDAIAGNLASSRSNAELIFDFWVLSKVS